MRWLPARCWPGASRMFFRRPSQILRNSNRVSRQRSPLCRACHARRLTAPQTRRWCLHSRTGRHVNSPGRSLLLTFSVPQFFFHVTTAYDILRHAGVDLAKKDFLGPPK